MRIGDLIRVEGLRSNQLVGYGLVVGLEGTGDSKRFPLTRNMVQNFIRSLGHKAYLEKNESRNCAAVLVTAIIPPFPTIGNRFDLQVASIGDARSLEGGVLIQTPLSGGDGKTYGVGQGSISIQSPGNNRRSAKRGENVGLVVKGGMIERELKASFIKGTNGGKQVTLVLNHFSFVTANRINDAIQRNFRDIKPEVLDGGHLRITMTGREINRTLASLMETRVTIPDIARVVIDEKSGVVIIGNQVRISPVVVSVEGLYIKEKKDTSDLQDLYGLNPSGEKKGKALFYIDKITSVKEIVDRLNEVGATTKNLIAILKAVNKSGSLHGELIVR